MSVTAYSYVRVSSGGQVEQRRSSQADDRLLQAEPPSAWSRSWSRVPLRALMVAPCPPD